LRRKRRRQTNYAMSRRAQKLILLLCFLIIAGAVWYERTHQKPAEPNFINYSRGADDDKYHCKKFTVVKVVDGDTLDLARISQVNPCKVMRF